MKATERKRFLTAYSIRKKIVTINSQTNKNKQK
jgi:hypothetical protein